MKNFFRFYYKNAYSFGIMLFLLGGFTLLFSLFSMLLLAELWVVFTFYWLALGIWSLGAVGTFACIIATIRTLLMAKAGRHRAEASM